MISYGWNPTCPNSIIADRKVRIGVKDEMVEEPHIHQAEDWRCVQLDRDNGTSKAL